MWSPSPAQRPAQRCFLHDPARALEARLPTPRAAPKTVLQQVSESFPPPGQGPDSLPAHRRVQRRAPGRRITSRSPPHFYRRLPAVDVSCRIDQKIDNRNIGAFASILIVSSTPTHDGVSGNVFPAPPHLLQGLLHTQFSENMTVSPRPSMSCACVSTRLSRHSLRGPHPATQSCEPECRRRGFAIHESSQSHLLLVDTFSFTHGRTLQIRGDVMYSSSARRDRIWQLLHVGQSHLKRAFRDNSHFRARTGPRHQIHSDVRHQNYNVTQWLCPGSPRTASGFKRSWRSSRRQV